MIRYDLMICAGCDEGTLKKSSSASYEIDRDRNLIWSVSFSPPRHKIESSVKTFQQLPENLEAIYRQAKQAYNYQLNMLSAIGLRSLMEGICVDKKAKGRNLEKKIDNLKEKTNLPDNIIQSLHSFRFMGNKAAHELKTPHKEELSLAIEVIENLLNFLYELDYKVRRLSLHRTPPKGTEAD